jgi:hypothetical protein
MTGEPLSEVGRLQVTRAEESAATAWTDVGAIGAPVGVTAFDGLLAALELPGAFEATTVKVYEVPLVSPVTVQGLDAALQVLPPGLEVTT